MTDDLLPYYNRELAALRRAGAAFADAHPKVAARLRLGADAVLDPHVARLIESAAFLNARIRHKLDDDFPELTDALLGVLYPHYLAPIPSMAIVQLEPAPDLTEAFVVPAGTPVETDRCHGDPCQYQTRYPATLLPLSVAHASLSGTPFDAPRTPRSTSSVAVLRLTLESSPDAPPISEVAPDSLRFFLGGQLQHAQALYELLLNDVVEIAVATSPKDRKAQVLPADRLHAVGFGDDEGLLPYPKRSFPGYRLLTEYFAFPSKFLFVELRGLGGPALERAGDKLELFFYLRRTSIDLQQNVGPRSFALGCTPIVNLFSKRAEPTRLTHTESEIRVVPDARRPRSVEVYSIDAVSAVDSEGKSQDYRAFYGVDHGTDGRAEPRELYYHAARRAAEASAESPDQGTEVYLQLVDGGFDTRVPADSVLTVETTCLSRDLPGKLPFGGDQPRLTLPEGGGPVERVRCLTAPTPTLRQSGRDGVRWRLISHLALNHLSISGEGAALALKEILRLYEFAGSLSNQSIIESILQVTSRTATMRIRAGRQSGFARGTEIALELDESRFSDHGLFLFASVLEVFLGSYCSINSFVQTTVTTNGRDGVLRRWAPRAGAGPLV